MVKPDEEKTARRKALSGFFRRARIRGNMVGSQNMHRNNWTSPIGPKSIMRMVRLQLIRPVKRSVWEVPRCPMIPPSVCRTEMIFTADI